MSFHHSTLSVCCSDGVSQFTATLANIIKQVKLCTWSLISLKIIIYYVTILVQVFSREVDINKWKIVCVVLGKHASLRVSNHAYIDFYTCIY